MEGRRVCEYFWNDAHFVGVNKLLGIRVEWVYAAFKWLMGEGGGCVRVL